MKQFLDEIQVYSDRFKTIKIGYSDKKKIEQTALKLLNLRDLNQLRDRFEGVLFYERFAKQLSCELALEKLLEIEFIDWEKKATIRDYLPKIEIDNTLVNINTINFGEYPVLINENIEFPEIFCIYKKTGVVSICGLATVENLQNNRKELNSGAMVKGTRMAFTGFKELKIFANVDDLKNILPE
ncbi:hypothetical protein [Siphonobacter sp. SORGH_AS_1065]|uniref:hypothetical protein n=1 Tax=Siphonobacter sp. SORGH_AS_1065 TaxID=3041795 RepID=UPI002789F96F|nr:hypothetical protein [Siphonobacter sp. SORGH_AS_1065]MDQ1085629.1 hypothetical protein [Siphonobacter sp. SORGH_AS_1065]